MRSRSVGPTALNLILGLLAVGSVLMPAAAAAQPATDSTPAIDLAQAHILLDAAHRITAGDSGRFWGRSLDGPILLADPVTRAIVGSAADSGGVLTPRDGLFVGVLPAEQNIANTALDWGGRRWTMLIWPGIPAGRYARDRLLAHELFHRIQGELGLTPPVSDNGHLDSEAGRSWLRLEWRALAEALLRRGAERQRAIEDALAFRAHRHARFPDRVDDERALELGEGLAEYTGFALSGLPAWVLADRTAMQLEIYDGHDSFVRSFAYASGPAYGVLLDEQGAPWRRALTLESDLGALLAHAALGDRPVRDEGEDALLVRAARYDGARVLAEEHARAARRAARVADYRHRFLDGPALELPMAGTLRYSFDPTAAEALDGVGTIYPGARITDAWGVLTVESGGVLLGGAAGRVERIVVAVAPGAATPPLAGEGWRLELATGWRVMRGARSGSWRVVRR